MAQEPSAAERATARRARPGTGELIGALDPTLPEIPSLIEAEQRIMQIDEALDQAVTDYETLSEVEASVRCDWEEHRDRFLVMLANDKSLKTVTESTAHAKAAISASGELGENLYRAWRMCESASSSKSKHIEALKSRLSALQTLVRGLRQVTGFDA